MKYSLFKTAAVTAAVTAALVAAWSASAAPAQSAGPISFSGFGTLGIAQTDTEDAHYRRDRQIEGIDNELAFDLDTNLGLQAIARPNEWLSATVQLLAMHRAEPNINLEVEWAFAKLELVDGLNVRLGRMALPMFLTSDFRNVGYANTWIRPPDEVYGLASLQRLEGADATYSLPVASSALSLSVLAGRSFIYAIDWARFPVDKVKGASLQWERAGVSLRAGYVSGTVRPTFEPPNLYRFMGFGATLDRNRFVAQAEYVMRRGKKRELTSNNGWYVLGGYRWGTLLPYFIYADTKPVYPNAPTYVTGAQSTVAAGLRWDAFKSAALKFQLQQVDAHGTQGASFATAVVAVQRNAPPIAAAAKSPVNVLALALDFAF